VIVGTPAGAGLAPERRIWDPAFELADRQTIQGHQLQRLKDLLRLTWARNDFYRERFAAAHVDLDRILTLEDFAAAVPTVSKPDFVADQGDDPPFGRRHVPALRSRQRLVVCTTSGTSGQGQEVHAQTAEELQHMRLHVYPYLLRWSGLEPGDSMFLCMPVTMFAGGQLEYEAAVGYGLTVYPVGNYDAGRKLDLMRRFRPNCLLANTSYLGHLATMLTAERRSPGLKCLISGGEGSGLAWLNRLANEWEAPVYDRYGSSQSANDHMFTCERGVGTPDRPGMLHNIESEMLFEVIDPASGRHVRDGEEGELVVTSLYRTTSPLIRCRMGDRAVYHEASYCGCGRPFAGVEVASISRMDDMRKVKGVNIWPQAVDDAVFAFAEVREYQVVLASSAQGQDVARALIMPHHDLPDDDASAALRTALADRLRQQTGIGFAVELVEPGALQVAEVKARRWVDERDHVQSRSTPRPSVPG
jgi:phenylacetate-CoA ligase